MLSQLTGNMIGNQIQMHPCPGWLDVDVCICVFFLSFLHFTLSLMRYFIEAAKNVSNQKCSELKIADPTFEHNSRDTFSAQYTIQHMILGQILSHGKGVLWINLRSDFKTHSPNLPMDLFMVMSLSLHNIPVPHNHIWPRIYWMVCLCLNIQVGLIHTSHLHNIVITQI